MEFCIFCQKKDFSSGDCIDPVVLECRSTVFVIQESFLTSRNKIELKCKEQGIDEGVSHLIYIIISVRFNF